MGRSSNRAGSANGPPAFLWPSPLGARAIRVRVPCCRSWFSLVRGFARSASAHSQALALMTLRASWLPPSQLHTGATVRLCAASGPLLASVIFNGRCERSCPPRALASALAPPWCTLVAARQLGLHYLSKSGRFLSLELSACWHAAASSSTRSSFTLALSDSGDLPCVQVTRRRPQNIRYLSSPCAAHGKYATMNSSVFNKVFGTRRISVFR